MQHPYYIFILYNNYTKTIAQKLQMEKFSA